MLAFFGRPRLGGGRTTTDPGEHEMRVQAANGDIEAQATDQRPAPPRMPLWTSRRVHDIQTQRARERGVASLAYPGPAPAPAEPAPAHNDREPGRLQRFQTNVHAFPAALSAMASAVQADSDDRAARAAARKKRKQKRLHDEQASLFGPMLSLGTGVPAASSPAAAIAQASPFTLDGPSAPGDDEIVEGELWGQRQEQGVHHDTLVRWLDQQAQLAQTQPRTTQHQTKSSTDSSVAPCSAIDLTEETEETRDKPEPMLCTSLQSYVNLKRNSVLLRPWSAIDSMDTQGPDPTHALSFELDSAASWAHIKVYVRASRKHGVWPALSSGDGVPGLHFAEAGMGPDQSLGYLVYSTRVPRTFDQRLTLPLPLRLSLFAPPGESKVGSDTKLEPIPSKTKEVEASDPNAVGSPDQGLEFEPVLLSHEPAQSTAPLSPPSSPPVHPGLDDDGLIPAERAKSVKAVRETLKAAVVVEALTDDELTLEPRNVQTTYLRLHSVRSTPTSGPSWSLNLEGQEVELGAHKFHLQELYGLSTLPPSSSDQVAPEPEPEPEHDHEHEHEGENEQERDEEAAERAVSAAMALQATAHGTTSDGECLICFSAQPTTLLLPCTHSLCRTCAIALRESVRTTRQAQAMAGRRMRKKYTCPMCRRAYTALLNLSLASE